MKSVLRRIVKLEQHAETFPLDLPPLPPPGASEEELVRAAHEAWRQLQAHPHHPGLFLHLIQIAQRFGVTSEIGQELFCDGAAQKAAASADTAPLANTGTVTTPPAQAPPAQASRPPRRPPRERDWTDW